MKNTFGNSVSLTLFGESHQEMIGCVLDGLAPGVPVREENVARFLSRRRPSGAISTPRREQDDFRIVSGVYQGRTTGAPLCILIENTAQRSSDYENAPLRPGHADFTAQMKYHGFQDRAGGGHFSGRLTAPLVAAGAVLTDILAAKGVFVFTHIAEIAGEEDRAFQDLTEDRKALENKSFPVLDDAAGERMREKILKAKEEGDSVGGVLETYVAGLPAGVGEPWFDSLEGLLSHALFSIPAVKGVEFGAGFAFARMRGSEGNDPFYLSGTGQILTKSNHNGGILGGISDGMPILFRTAVKPTPTISKEQETVDLATGKECRHAFRGRHDPCIAHRACVVQDSLTALVLCDALALRYGTDFLGEK